jgi:hypothetical protein
LLLISELLTLYFIGLEPDFDEKMRSTRAQAQRATVGLIMGGETADADANYLQDQNIK